MTHLEDCVEGTTSLTTAKPAKDVHHSRQCGVIDRLRRKNLITENEGLLNFLGAHEC